MMSNTNRIGVKNSIEDVDSLTSSLKEWVIEFPNDGKDEKPRKIYDLKSLSANLPDIASTVFNRLGSQENEATYQQCLKIDLEEAGVHVQEEVEIPLIYKSQVVGSRRADLVLTMDSGDRAVIELKAVVNMTSNHSDQLKFYMHHLHIAKGYLINFPHDTGFPISFRSSVLFYAKTLSGIIDERLLHDRVLRLQNDPKITASKVQVMEVDKRALSGTDERMRSKPQLQLWSSSSPLPPSSSRSTQWGITKKGTPCKICISLGDFCHYHERQRCQRYF